MVDGVLAERVQSVLLGNPHVVGRNLNFEAQHGRVVLRGTVGSYYQKLMAQEMLRRVEGVEQIENQLQVHWK